MQFTFVFPTLLIVMATITAVKCQFGLTAAQEKNIRLGLCQPFTLEACLPDRIRADRSLPACKTNKDCQQPEVDDETQAESYCCPSKCAGMRCLPFRQNSFVEIEGCIVPTPSVLLANCDRIGYECTRGCKCCLDVSTCSRRCID